MKIDGSCHCGRIRFEAEADPTRVSVCHCTDCQQLSGTAFRVSVLVDADSFRLLDGTPRQYLKTAASGNRRIQAFCGECGSPIYASDVDDPRHYALRLGGITQRALLQPKKQIWNRSRLAWVDDIAELPASDGQ